VLGTTKPPVRKPGRGSLSEQHSPQRFCQARLRHPVPCWIRLVASLATKGTGQNATSGGWKWNPLFLGFCCRAFHIVAFYFWVYERLDSESPQQKPLDGEALALIANLSQRNPRIENRGRRKRLPRRRFPRVSLEIPRMPSDCYFLPLSLKFSTVEFYCL
jgi:hypothetical protein